MVARCLFRICKGVTIAGLLKKFCIAFVILEKVLYLCIGY